MVWTAFVVAMDTGGASIGCLGVVGWLFEFYVLETINVLTSRVYVCTALTVAMDTRGESVGLQGWLVG